MIGKFILPSRGAPGSANELHVALGRCRAFLIWTFVASIFVNLLMLAGPLYMLQVYDRVLTTRSVDLLISLTVLVAGLFALMALLDYARGRLMARAGARVQSALDARVFKAVLQKRSNREGPLGSAVALRDLDAIQTLLASPVLLAVMDMAWTPLFIAAIFVFHPLLGWLAIAGGSVLVAMTMLNHIVTAHRVRLGYISNQDAHRFADAALAGDEIILTQGMQEAFTQRWVQHRATALRKAIAANDWTGTFSSFTKSFRLFLQSAMLGAGAYFVLQDEVTVGVMIAGSILLGRALAPIEQAMGQWPVLQRGIAAWVSLGNYLTASPLEAIGGAKPERSAVLTVKDLTVTPPGAKAPALHDLRFNLEPGQALGVIGHSGSGKSTLARALTGYWPIAQGDVQLGGTALEAFDPQQLGQYIGYLPQTVTLFAGTLAENIARMAVAPDMPAVIAAAQSANAHDMIMRLPNNYNTMLDGPDTQLSGGQRQRIGLARAFFGNPPLLVLDEPNAALDGEGTSALNDAVRRHKSQGKTVIVMTHRPLAVAECDLLMVIKEGRMTAFGPREDVLTRMITKVHTTQKTMRRGQAS